MEPTTVQRLNQINREFYRITAYEFDRTRGAAWPGWERLLPYLRAPLSALDVGCGNGRFGLFLHGQVTGHRLPASGDENAEHAAGKPELRYHGVDNSTALLERARAALADLPGLTATLEARDIVENPPDCGAYDLVALFGVIHHVPGYTQRQDLLRRLAERVKPGGLLAFAAWRFYEYDRFRERTVPWPAELDVEANDFLLDWRQGTAALRYCHYVDDAEHAALIAASGLREILAYRADGQTGDANRYSILQRS